MNNFIPQFVPQIRPKDIEAVKKQMESGWVGSGERVLEFEDMLRYITGAKHCISTTSGTTAIIIALKSLDMAPVPQVAFPAYTFLAGANACRFLEYDVELIDVNLKTLSMKPDDFNAHPRDKFDCAIYVNHNAYCGSDVQRFKSGCNNRGIPMIEDSSQALGIKNAGRTGDIGIFSFSVPKLITTGQGGAIITDHDHLAKRCREIRDHGDNNWKKTKLHIKVGANFKFNDILAAYGLSQLEDIHELLEQRKFVFDCYRNHLELIDFDYSSTWMVVYQTEFAKEVISALADQKVQAVQYYEPIDHNPPFECLGSYLCAEELSRTIVYLPSSLSLTREQIDKVCNTINAIERNGR